MSIQGFNIEEDNEEIRDEIEEGVNMYEEDKAIPAYDIKLTLDDVSGMIPRQIINTYEEDIKKKNLELKEKRIELNEIMTAIKNIENNNDVVISEHGILRYLERVKGFNLEDIKNEMLDARTRESLKVLPVNKIKCDGYNLIIKNKVITTVTL